MGYPEIEIDTLDWSILVVWIPSMPMSGWWSCNVCVQNTRGSVRNPCSGRVCSVWRAIHFSTEKQLSDLLQDIAKQKVIMEWNGIQQFKQESQKASRTWQGGIPGQWSQFLSQIWWLLK